MSSAANVLPRPLTSPLSSQLRAQSELGLFSLMLANALWMVVDISSWQRIASVGREGDGFPLRSLQRGTLRVACESPATWLLGVVLGWSISFGAWQE